MLVKYVDVQQVGLYNINVGFSHINGFFYNLIGHHLLIYKISEIFGLLLLLLVVIYGCIGLHQLIKRKSFLKVDKEIIILGCFYVAMLIVYIIFEKVFINYRPVLIDGQLEFSYPSSHTVLSLCVGISSLIISKKYFNKKYINTINIITAILMLLVLITRFLSGVHWFTNLDHGRRHEPLQLMSLKDNLRFSKHAEVREKGYRKYDNYDAIEVPYTDAIPDDFEGIMGVPISFLDKYCPEQFRILGMCENLDIYGLKTRVYTSEECRAAYVRKFGKPGTYDLNASGVIKMEDGHLEKVYQRILIQKI